MAERSVGGDRKDKPAGQQPEQTQQSGAKMDGREVPAAKIQGFGDIVALNVGGRK